MKTICAWCKKEMRDGATDPSELVSHGICENCIKVVFGYQRTSLKDYLDTLEAPVLVVNGEGNVECANRQALGMLHKEMPKIEGNKGGVVFECAFAVLPEGCGDTIHCDACTIRNTVMSTMQTGEPHLYTPAQLTQGTPEDNEELNFLISTEKVADVVLLRIDKVEKP